MVIMLDSHEQPELRVYLDTERLLTEALCYGLCRLRSSEGPSGLRTDPGTCTTLIA
jgi:hypothetical protein